MGLNGKTVLALVPARRGSKGIPEKNLQLLGGVTLIGWAGMTLGRLPWVDARVISTDSAEYAAEARRYGLDAPFFRDAALSGDEASVMDAIKEALVKAEAHYGSRFDVIVLLEPTSPLRTPADVERTVRMLIESNADTAFTVSRTPMHYHPLKSLTIRDGRLELYLDEGATVVRRQQLETWYWRNGVCYALTRRAVVEGDSVLTSNTVPVVIEHPIVNIDTPRDLALASLLLALQDE